MPRVASCGPKGRPRTKLSPLIENTCSPIHTSNPCQSAPLFHAVPSPEQLLPSLLPPAARNRLWSPLGGRTLSSAHSVPACYHRPFCLPAHSSGMPSSQSPVTACWNHSTGIQSVPPWFIFSQYTGEGKVRPHPLPSGGCFFYSLAHTAAIPAD